MSPKLRGSSEYPVASPSPSQGPSNPHHLSWRSVPMEEYHDNDNNSNDDDSSQVHHLKNATDDIDDNDDNDDKTNLQHDRDSSPDDDVEAYITSLLHDNIDHNSSSSMEDLIYQTINDTWSNVTSSPPITSGVMSTTLSPSSPTSPPTLSPQQQQQQQQQQQLNRDDTYNDYVTAYQRYQHRRIIVISTMSGLIAILVFLLASIGLPVLLRWLRLSHRQWKMTKVLQQQIVSRFTTVDAWLVTKVRRKKKKMSLTKIPTMETNGV
jgi:hypothetical protein